MKKRTSSSLPLLRRERRNARTIACLVLAAGTICDATPCYAASQIPSVKTYSLSNGLKVQIVEDHQTPSVTASIGIKAGSTLDDPHKLGVCEMTANLITRGTETRKGNEITSEIDSIGGALKASSDYDFSILNGSCPSNHGDQLLALMADVIMQANFPQDEIKADKVNLSKELNFKWLEREFILNDRFRKAVFANHPYRVVAPSSEMIATIKRVDLVKFRDHNYIPNQSALVVIGDLDIRRTEVLIANLFGSWKPERTHQEALPPVARPREKRIYLIDRPGSVNSSLMVGNLGIKKNDPDYFAAEVLSQILSGGDHSTFDGIRSAAGGHLPSSTGYMRGARSTFSARLHPDAFAVTANARADDTAACLKEVLMQLERIGNSKVPDQELIEARNKIIERFQLSLKTQNGLAQNLLEVSLHDLPENYLENYCRNIMAVNANDVERAARRIIQTHNLVICVIGDASKLSSQLAPLAPIEIYDANGQLTTRTDPKHALESGS